MAAASRLTALIILCDPSPPLAAFEPIRPLFEAEGVEFIILKFAGRSLLPPVLKEIPRLPALILTHSGLYPAAVASRLARTEFWNTVAWWLDVTAIDCNAKTVKSFIKNYRDSDAGRGAKRLYGL